MKKLTIEASDLRKIKKMINQNEVLAVPTDTNYNLIANPFSEKGLEKIFEYKERTPDKPLSIFLYNPFEMKRYAKNYDEIILDTIISEYLPGPLNIVLDKSTDKFDNVLNGKDSISFGSVKNKKWRKIISYLDTPIALTSANISGTMDNGIVTKEILLEQMDKKVEYYVESNGIRTDKSSTIIKIQESRLTLLREGNILFSNILNLLDEKGIKYEN